MKIKIHEYVYYLSVILILAMGCIVIYGLWLSSHPQSMNLANFPSSIEQIQSNIDPNHFTFLVSGDPKGGTATFENLVESVTGDNPAFLVVMGDFVNQPTVMNHKLFAYEMSEHSRKTKIFVIPGNHDISPDSFTVEDFRATYGADQFSFTIGHNLFIFLNDLPQYNNEGQYLTFLEKTLSDFSGKSRKTFIFMHIPPTNVIPGLLCNSLQKNEDFLKLIRKYNVDYVFAGDHHGYAKKKAGSTNFIVSGGGGARLRGQHGKFFHIIRIAVDNEDVAETVIAGKHQIETSELLEYNIAVYLWPALCNHPLYSIAVFLFAVGYVVCFKLNKHRRIYETKITQEPQRAH
ncbi:MAG: metallophosphoesterase [Sedimentisphaerales bacterium]|nr:metallophosphoesterase [Sedimentisphaerales bacterium]